MTKHNGRARNSGIKVGAALMAARKKGGAGSSNIIAGKHTTDVHKPGPNMQSVVERNDLDELMAMADLAERDFTAEKGNVVVISTGAVTALEQQRAAEERAAAEARHAHRLSLPRRPAWDETTTPEQLDAQERAMFLSWRRDLAHLEEEERLVLTPFEKNLEVWRQLWRVLERSDIVVQVVDARDPLLYRCEDLEKYARDLHASKTSLLLLNKADLLPLPVRQVWAKYLDKVGIKYAFWSAHAVMDEHASLKAEAQELGVDWHDLREARCRDARLARVAADAALAASAGPAAVAAAKATRILGVEELLELLETAARQAVAAAGPDDPRAAEPDRRLMVGLVGYPNVGKSSTINALFGAKKTAVAPTPGKTKHFQTLLVSPTLCLCDCPGLVMPKFARSKAEMVAAGVIPIDRLTDIRAPVGVLAQRVGRRQVEELYGMRLPPAPAHVRPSAAQLLRGLAMLRGWTVSSALPDESRAGRQLLKDYTSGKLLHCTLPPDHDPPAYAPYLNDADTLASLEPRQASQPAEAPSTSSGPSGGSTDRTAPVVLSPRESPAGVPSTVQEEEDGGDGSGSEDGLAGEGQGQGHGAQAPLAGPGELDAADLDLLAGELGDLSGLGGASSSQSAAAKARRAAHKFQKKVPRGKVRSGGTRDEYDGGAMNTGKKGGLVRVAGY